MNQPNIENLMYFLAVRSEEVFRARLDKVLSQGTQLPELVAALIYIDAAGTDTRAEISAILGPEKTAEAERWAYENWPKFRPAIDQIETLL